MRMLAMVCSIPRADLFFKPLALFDFGTECGTLFKVTVVRQTKVMPFMPLLVAKDEVVILAVAERFVVATERLEVLLAEQHAGAVVEQPLPCVAGQLALRIVSHTPYRNKVAVDETDVVIPLQYFGH